MKKCSSPYCLLPRQIFAVKSVAAVFIRKLPAPTMASPGAENHILALRMALRKALRKPLRKALRMASFAILKAIPPILLRFFPSSHSQHFPVIVAYQSDFYHVHLQLLSTYRTLHVPFSQYNLQYLPASRKIRTTVSSVYSTMNNQGK